VGKVVFTEQEIPEIRLKRLLSAKEKWPSTPSAAQGFRPEIETFKGLQVCEIVITIS